MVVEKMTAPKALPQTALSPLEVVKSWHQRPACITGDGTTNALTIDVEDYFQVEAFFKVIDRDSWDNFDCRIERNVALILELLAESKSKATFFTLGWIAQRFPSMVRTIVSEGHELASHGSEHQRADAQGRTEFLLDLLKSKRTLEDLTGTEVKGYRAPSFSIVKENLWALEQIAFAGYRYSSSIYPVVHDTYGIPEAPRFAFHPFLDDAFIEIPVTSLRVGSKNVPCGGGGYFRLLPYALNSAALRRVNRREKQACVFYFHPWELDVHQPRIPGASAKSRFRHYLNLRRMKPRLTCLLKEFQWRSMEEIFLPSRATARS